MCLWLSLCITALIGFLTFFIFYNKKLKTFKKEFLEQELWKQEENYERKVEELEQQLKKVKENIHNEIKEEEFRRELVISAIKRQVDAKSETVRSLKAKEFEHWQEKEISRISDNLKQKTQEAEKLFEVTKNTLNEELNKLIKKLEDYKSKQDTINKAIQREKQIAEQIDFYRIILPTTAADDIKLLESIRLHLTNREALSKLIYEVFYKKPLGEMINRVLQGKTICGIYKITNLKTGESYIGKSTDIKKRWTEHIKTSLDIGSIAKTRIHSALRDCGADNFSFEVLEECPKEQYTEREKYWINFYNTQIYGYNIQK